MLVIICWTYMIQPSNIYDTFGRNMFWSIYVAFRPWWWCSRLLDVWVREPVVYGGAMDYFQGRCIDCACRRFASTLLKEVSVTIESSYPQTDKNLIIYYLTTQSRRKQVSASANDRQVGKLVKRLLSTPVQHKWRDRLRPAKGKTARERLNKSNWCYVWLADTVTVMFTLWNSTPWVQFRLQPMNVCFLTYITVTNGITRILLVNILIHHTAHTWAKGINS